MFGFVSGRVFFPEQEEVQGLWVHDCQENSLSPFRKETCLHALLKGAAHDIIRTHPLSLWPCCCVCCVEFLFLLSPIGLYPCLCVHVVHNFVCVPVFCKLAKLFPHLLWLSSKTLQPWGSHPPTQPLPALPLFQSTLAPTDKALCVILTCFLSTGAPNSTSGPPWITNAPTVGPQTAHCLSYSDFRRHSRGLSEIEAGICCYLFTVYWHFGCFVC